MAKIARKTQKIFASTPGTNQLAQFGSYAAGTPAYSSDPAVIQSLSNYLVGWFDAVIGSNSPCIEDMNALCFLFAYQLAYLFQAGIAEWDSGTTYYAGSLANDGAGNIYVSLTNANTGNALSSTTNWAIKNNTSVVQINPATASPYTMTAADNGKTFWVNSANGPMTFTLPAAASSGNFFFIVKDVGGLAALSAITIARNASELIENYGANYLCQSDYGTWNFACNATNWFIDN